MSTEYSYPSCRMLCFVYADSSAMHVSVIDCGPLDHPANGDVSVSSTVFSFNATYSCNTGYTLTGHGIRTCLETGFWSGSEPICTGKMHVYVMSQCLFIHDHHNNYVYKYFHTVYLIHLVIDCGTLGDPANGEVSLSGTIFNSVATYSCNTGYNLTGHGIRACLHTGFWSGSEPTCAGK